MSDGSRWSIPIKIIANHRASYYANHDHVSFEDSLNKDTLPLFADDIFEIADWARNNMDWSDVAEHAKRLRTPVIDYQHQWVNPSKWNIQDD
jgi:hypothetical protein